MLAEDVEWPLGGQNPKCSSQGTQQPLFFHPPNPRQKIFKEKALPDIENYMFENHDQLRQAATECMCNMVVNKEVRGLQMGVIKAWRVGPQVRAWC